MRFHWGNSGFLGRNFRLSAPESPTHALVTRLALSIAGKKVPYTREDLLKSLWQ